MKDRQSVESISDRLQEFETTFTSLQQQMEVDDYHDLVGAYAKKEEENFALFRYVQSINNEIEQLDDEKHALEKEMQKYVSCTRSRQPGEPSLTSSWRSGNL